MKIVLGVIVASVLTVGGVIMMKRPKELNHAGIELIKRFEGFSPTPYRDVAGYMTIGYGHLIRDGETFTRLTESEAQALLVRDAERFVHAVNTYVTVPITQNMFNSLVSFSYNIGVNAFINSTLLKKLNAGDYIGAVNELDRWTKAGGVHVDGLANRREAEKEVFFS